MAKLFTGKAKFGFAFNQTGAQPLDDRSVVQNFDELINAETFGTAIYNGMIVATVDEQKVYMLVDDTKSTSKDGWKEIGVGTGSLSLTNFTIVDGQIKDATGDNIGQIIYITEGTTDYPKGPYVVSDVGEVLKLGIISGNGDIASIASDVEQLKQDVAKLPSLIDGVEDKADTNTADITNIKGDLYDQNGLLVLAKSSDVYTQDQIDGKLSDYVTTASYNEFVESTTSNFQSINNTIDSLGDTYATIASVSDIDTSVQKLRDDVDDKAAQSDLDGAVGRIGALETAVNTNIPKTYATQSALQGLTDIVNALPTYTIEKSETAETGYASSYKLMAGETQVGATINIPKDMVVESGVVRKLTEDEVAAGKGDADAEYIVLTLSNATEDTLYIKASSLVDVYTAGSYITISDTKVVSVNIDAVCHDIESSLLTNKTFATPTQVNDAKDAAIAAAATDASNKAIGAKDAAIAHINTELAKYTTTTDLVNDYASKAALQGQKDELETLIGTEDSKLDVRLQLVEEQLGLGNTGEDGGPSVSQQLADAIVDVATLKAAVGTKADGETAATGIYGDVASLNEQISGLSDTVVKKISLNNVDYEPNSGTITIDVANEIKEEGNTDSALISLGAAKTYVDSKVNTINLSLETLEKEKTSIKLVTADSDATSANVIYLVGDAKAPKVVIDGALHTLGSNLYASIDKYASADEDGLMSKDDFTRLYDIGAIDTQDITDKINEINSSYNNPAVPTV